MKLLILAGLSFSAALPLGYAAVPLGELRAVKPTRQQSPGTLCTQVALPVSLPLVGDPYIDDKTVLRLEQALAPVISDTANLPGHPRRALQVVVPNARTPDYAAWWPRNVDSLALFWRFGAYRAVYVATAVSREGNLSGRLFLTIGARHEGPIPFRANHVACITPPAA